jgi:hypothetical protein
LADFPVWPGTSFTTKSLLIAKIMIPVLHALHWNMGLDGTRFDADWYWLMHHYLVFEVVWMIKPFLKLWLLCFLFPELMCYSFHSGDENFPVISLLALSYYLKWKHPYVAILNFEDVTSLCSSICCPHVITAFDSQGLQKVKAIMKKL